jgi:hypothetical protein
VTYGSRRAAFSLIDLADNLAGILLYRESVLPRGKSRRSRNNHNRHDHPMLKLNAKDAEILD